MSHLQHGKTPPCPSLCCIAVSVSSRMANFQLGTKGRPHRLAKYVCGVNNNNLHYSIVNNRSCWCPFYVSQMGSDRGERRDYASAKILCWIYYHEIGEDVSLPNTYTHRFVVLDQVSCICPKHRGMGFIRERERAGGGLGGYQAAGGDFPL